ncbi:MAG TPA: hypothetical protein VK869_09820 [Rubrobacteraceae bacterium]|nr:hypothetical protein [Rubrobacteraceae bacterium]
MSDGSIQHPLLDGDVRCEFERTLSGEYCAEEGQVQLDGLRLCERHATQLRLEGRAAYWRAMVAHIELWSGEAQRRGSKDVVRLLEVERERSTAALESASEELQRSRDGRSEDGEDGSGDGRAPPPW